MELSAEQIEAGSKFLAASNLGQEGVSGKLKSVEDVRNLWRQVLMAFEYEGLTGAEEERRHWKEQLLDGNDYCVGVIREELSFLFSEEVK